MDICTIVMSVNAAYCAELPKCQQVDNDHQICSPVMCPIPPVHYECVTPEGVHYIWTYPADRIQ
jgi:hypothetical protein